MLITALYGLTGASSAFWGVSLVESMPGGPAAWAWAAALMLPSGWLGARLARRLLPGRWSALRWTGEGWSVGSDDALSGVIYRPLARLAVALDLGPWLLLKGSDAQGARSWLVLRQRQAGPSWHLLRVALQAHATGPGAWAAPDALP